MHIGEINVICTDLARSRDFYCSLLGFEAVEEEGGCALHCRLGSHRLLLLAVAGRGAERKPYCESACLSFDLITDDLAGTCSRLKVAGVNFEREPDGRMAVVRDPDGNCLEIVQSGAVSFGSGG
jgi:catechol 2,3-dioxygenase-like lactoylglutathione lyase family enzyme